MVRAKFQVTEIATNTYGYKRITLTPNYDQSIPEDKRYAKATPSGTIQLTIDNPPAVDYLSLGEYFYVDFTKVD
jgi:hypothetical protein